jgi:hypothetical protein
MEISEYLGPPIGIDRLRDGFGQCSKRRDYATPLSAGGDGAPRKGAPEKAILTTQCEGSDAEAEMA